MTTKSVCEKKSNDSLEYRKDFWDFYLTNKPQVDHIIQGCVHSVMAKWGVHYLDPQDVISNMMELLRTRNFLIRWNQDKSSLKTYLVRYVRFYTSHILEREIRQNKLVPNEQGIRVSRLGRSIHDEVYDSIDLMQSINSTLTEQEALLLKLKMQGYTHSEISKRFNKSITWVSIKLHEIRDTLKDMLHKG